MSSGARAGLPDRVVAELLAAVAAGEHSPGSRLPPEAVLAQRAGVSRLTLREAVKVLRDKGVLRVEQGRGTFVNPPSEWSTLDPSLLAARSMVEGGSAATAQHITETRRIVEVGAAELAAHRRVESHLHHLRDTISRMQRADGADDVPAFSAADVAFHDGIMLAAGNPFLAALLQPLKALVHDVRVQTSLTHQMRATAITAHLGILDAVAAGNQAEARRTMTEHLAETHRVIERLSATGRLPVHPAPMADLEQDRSAS